MLRDMYRAGRSDAEIAQVLGRGEKGVARKRLELGLVRRRRREWTDEMDLFVVNYWQEKPDEWMAKKLGVTLDGYLHRRRSLGLKRERRDCIGVKRGLYKKREDGWAELELAYLKAGYGKVANKRMAKALGRPLSSVTGKLSRMGLTGGGLWIRDENELVMLDEREAEAFLDMERRVKEARDARVAGLASDRI